MTRLITWTDRSMLHQLVYLILILFSTYLVVSTMYLNRSIIAYQTNIDKIMKETLTDSTNKTAQSVMTSSRIQAETYFKLQEQLINKTSSLFIDLLAKKLESQGEQNPHVLDWEKQDKIRSYNDANLAWVQNLRDGGKDLRKYEKEKFGFDYFGLNLSKLRDE